MISTASIADLLDGALKTSYYLPAVAVNQPGKNKNRMNRADYLEGFAARLSRQIASGASTSLFNSRGELPRSGLPDCSSVATPWANFNELALELFELQFESNLAYRRFCEIRRCPPGEITMWHRIPAVPTTAFKEVELSCLPAQDRSTVFFSSGTTQMRPSRHFHSPTSLKVYEQSLTTWFKCQLGARIRPRRALALTPNAGQAPNSSLVHMFETLRRDLSFSRFDFAGAADAEGAWMLNQNRSVEFLREAVGLGEPCLIFGTAFSYVHLLDFLREQNQQLRMPAGSFALETGGYKGRSRTLPKPELHSSITQQLGIAADNIISEYGMSELSSQAYDHVVEAGGARRFQFPPWARVQIISPETGLEAAPGQAGLIRVFDLANVYSVVAIQTEDLGLSNERGFELLGRAPASEPRGCSLMSNAAVS